MISTAPTPSASNPERSSGAANRAAWLARQKSWRKGSARPLVVLLVAGVAASAAALWMTDGFNGAGLQPSGPAKLSGAAQALFARCTRAMLQRTCGVMRGAGQEPGALVRPAPDAQARVFVAGAGEVDAAVYARLLSQGDAMCAEVAQACEQAWTGSSCRIARALYPAGG